MKKTFFTLIGLCAFVFSLPAQDCDAYFPMEEGASFEMTSYNDKDKVQGRTVSKVKELKSSGNTREAVVQVQSFDKKDKENYTSEYSVYCKDGNFTVDMRSMMNAENMASMQGMEVDVEADEMAFPPNLQPGTELPDAHLKVSMRSAAITMAGIKVDVTNRKVSARDKITTPAGIFDCLVVTQDVESRTMGIPVRASSKVWYAQGVGTVRSESYNKNGKLMGYEVLTKLEK